MSLILDHMNGIPDDNRIENPESSVLTALPRSTPLWPQEPAPAAGLCDVRKRVHSAPPPAAVLLCSVRHETPKGEARSEAGAPEGRTPVVRATDGGRRVDELRRDRSQVRRLGQRGQEVDPLVREPTRDRGVDNEGSRIEKRRSLNSRAARRAPRAARRPAVPWSPRPAHRAPCAVRRCAAPRSGAGLRGASRGAADWRGWARERQVPPESTLGA